MTKLTDDQLKTLAYTEIIRLRTALEEKDKTPDFARGFNAGKDATLRRNPSGCCCKFTEFEDEEDIVSLCAAHQEYVDNRLESKTRECEELKDSKLNRHDEVMMWVEKCKQLEAELAAMKEELQIQKWRAEALNPCNHSAVESISCDICGYPDPRRLITAMKEAKEKAENKKCEWKYMDDDSDSYTTSCGNAYCFMAGTLSENDYKYCPGCGGKIVEIAAACEE